MRTLTVGVAFVGLASLVSLVSLASGCGGVSYAIAVNAAASRVEEAKALGADQLAPYEYYFAAEHLRQAQIEAGEASYSDAANLAEEAEEHANTAIQLSQKAKRTR